MTADILTAAQREVRKPASEGNPIAQFGVTTDIAFVRGAVWAAARVTPTREQLIERIAGKYFAEHLPGCGEHTEVSVPLAKCIADVVLDLMQELAEGESGNP